MEEKKPDYMAWIRWILTVAVIVATWLASKRDQPIVIPPPPAIQIVPFAVPSQSGCGCQGVGIEAKAEIARVRPLRNLLVKALKKRLPTQYTDAQIDAAFAQVEAESDRPWLDWFTNGGFEKLVEMILRILTLLG